MTATMTRTRTQPTRVQPDSDTRAIAEALVALDEAELEKGLWDSVRRGLVEVAITEDAKALEKVIKLLKSIENPPDEVKKALDILKDLAKEYEAKGKGEGEGKKLPPYGKKVPAYGQQTLPPYGGTESFRAGVRARSSFAEAKSVAKLIAKAIASLEKVKAPSKEVKMALKALRDAQEAYEQTYEKSKKQKKAKESLVPSYRPSYTANRGNGHGSDQALRGILSRLDRLENERKIESAVELLDEMLNESDLPTAAQRRIEEQFKAQVRSGHIPTRREIQEAINAESEYAHELVYHVASNMQGRGLSSIPVRGLKESARERASAKARVARAFGVD